MGADNRSAVADIVAGALRISAAEMADDPTLAQLGADGLDMVEIVMGVEDRYDVVFTNDEAAAVTTIADLVALVERKRMPS